MTAVRTILFAIYPVRSHYYAVLGVAKELQNSGWNVCFTGGLDEGNDSWAKKQGFDVVHLKGIPFGIDLADGISLYKRTSKRKVDYIFDLLNKDFFETRRHSFEELLVQLQPEYVVVDAYAGADVLSIYQVSKENKIGLCLINTMIPFDLTKANPTSTLHAISPRRLKGMLMQFVSRVLEFFLTGGRTKTRQVVAALRRVGLPKQTLVDNSPISISFRNIPELILSSSHFAGIRQKDAFSQEILDRNQIFIGFNICPFRYEFIERQVAESIKRIFISNPIFVLVSFGSQPRRFESSINDFVNVLAKVAAHFQTCQFAVLNMKQGAFRGTNSVPANLHFFGFLPQLTLLRKSRLFITHGGFNSIKEAIFCSVPMIVMPLNPRFDQFANAERVQALGIGIKADIRSVSPSQLKNKIEQVLYSDSFREAMSDVKKSELNDCGRFGESIKSLILTEMQ